MMRRNKGGMEDAVMSQSGGQSLGSGGAGRMGGGSGGAGTRAWEATTWKGLVTILEDGRAPVEASCAAVEECLAVNK
eukprot:jgi/Picsp_1/4026/NSC_01538-R1_---NA---